VFFTSFAVNYRDWPDTTQGGPLSFNFTKQKDSTRLIVHLFGSGYSPTSANTDFSVGVRINSTDYDLCTMRYTHASDHQFYMGMREWTGMAAGIKTITHRIKKTSGTSFQCDQNDHFGLFVEERE
jgi:hypothetical protein